MEIHFTLFADIFGCPKACNITGLNVHLRFGHANSFIDPYNKLKLDPENDFYLGFSYTNIETEERVETLAYDVYSFLAAAGGNLGLALGCSCLSVLIEALEALFRLFNKVK